MAIVTMLLVGLVVGALAKLIMPGRDPGGIVVTMALGAAGALAAGLIGHELGWYASGQSGGIVTSVLGSTVMLAIGWVLTSLRTSSS